MSDLARLPWQWCVGLAPVAWLIFHWLAQLEPPTAQGLSEMGVSVAVTLFKTAGMFLQVLAPAALLIAGLLSWLGQRRRQRLLADAEERSDSQPLRTLSWRDFERLVAAHFERQGYAVTITPDGADGGVDVVATKNGETHLVQCQQWRASKVGVSVVRELYGVMSARGAVGGFVVSIGEFTEQARDFADGRNMTLVDANRLLPSSASSSEPQQTRTVVNDLVCPRCGSEMVRRIAQRGANQGKPFLGCSTYPRCRETRSI